MTGSASKITSKLARLLRSYAVFGQSRLRGLLGLRNRKVFCVGRNKTGTTSLAGALADLGFLVGNQRAAEMLIEDWGRRDFRKLIALCHTAEAFQDIPFSQDFTFQAMDSAFPGSKFILTVRDSPEQWYESSIRFTAKRLGLNRPPTADDLKQSEYVWKGWSYRLRELAIGPKVATWFDRDRMIAHYNAHNDRVVSYFQNRPNDLLVVNVAEENAMKQVCEFLGRRYRGQKMPHLNASE
jgi:hypothetical protein